MATKSELPSTMKAWTLEEFNTPYVLREIPLPTITTPHDILVKVTACSYCHTDAVVAAGTVIKPPLPHIGCHEFAGVIAALPPGQDSCHGLRVGDRVAVPGRGNHVCGTCLECQDDSAPLPDPKGFSVFCPKSGAGLGVDRPGGFREYAVVDARQVARIPEGLEDAEVAPLMCAGLTIFSALLKLNLKEGQRLGIMGCGGGLGHLGLQFATKMGLRVTGFDVSKSALELSKKLDTGATILDSSKQSAKEVREKMGKEDEREFLDQMGLDAVVILPESQKAFDYGVELVRNGGKVMLLSFPPDGFHVSAFDVVIRRISVEGSLIGSNAAMREMLLFCMKHKVKAQITRYPFGKLNELVEDNHKGVSGKLVLDLGMSE